MQRALVTLVLACALVSAASPVVADVALPASTFASTNSTTSPPPSPSPSIVAAYPNPIADGDDGEFLAVSLPDDADPDAYTVTDGETTVPLANASAGVTVAIASHPRAKRVTDRPVLLAPSLSLANGGERIRIERNGTVVDRRRYRDAPEGDTARWNGSRIGWRPVGATDRPVVSAGADTVRAFVLPDEPGVPIGTLRGADRRILLAGYTLTADRVADALVRARGRNLTVTVLLEGQPVGGRTRREARVLDRLVRAGVEVRLVGGPHARYDYHHAKYAVVDDRAIVMTENWKPAGTGGNSSRGWGVVTGQPAIVDGLVATFRADVGWRDAKRWSSFREGRRFERGGRSTGSYPSRFEARNVRVERTDLLVTPDNAQTRLIRTIDRANDSIDVIQVTVGDWDSPLLRALRRAAGRGVEVRVLLSSAWYARKDNRAIARRFDEWANQRDAPLSVKLADPGGRYGKIHAKGAVVDDGRVVLGSLNWNEQAATANREVVLLLHGAAVADYYGDVFDADWTGGKPTLPVGIVVAVVGGLVLVVLVARKLVFET